MVASDKLKQGHAFWCFALAVALLPIGLGGNRPIPVGIAEIMLAVSAVLLMREKTILSEVYFFNRIKVALGLVCAVIVWAWLQTTGFFPSSWNHPLWKETATALQIPVSGSIALAPDAAILGLSRLITYVACAFLAYIFGQSTDRARTLLKMIWYSGVGICAYGLVIYITGNHTILWFAKWGYFDDLTATVVNRNHFAIYAGMVLVTGAALLMQSWRDHVQKIAKPHRAKKIQEWLMKTGLPQLGMLALVLICILLSHSRAGLVLTLGGFGSYIFFYQIYLKAWTRGLLVGVLAAAALGVVFLVAGQFSGRFAVLFHDNSSLDRFKVYKLTWEAICDNPLLGYGLNGFQSVFRLYQRNMVMEFNRAHSDILESLLDLGIPFGLLLWGSIASLLSGLWHGVCTRRRNGIYPSLGLAVSAMLLAHATVDFSMQIPCVVFCWLALAGTGLAQSWGQTEKQARIDARG